MTTKPTMLAGRPTAGDNPAIDVVPLTLVMSEKKAARILDLSSRSLQRHRLNGGGPRFIQLTERRIGYTIEDIQAWIRKRAMSSTSDATVRTK